MKPQNKNGSIKTENSGTTEVHIGNIYEKLEERKKEINQEKEKKSSENC